ncbi:hypothetical protein [Amycolatopsis sp.]|uniref:hypothetical protein n=1 Tax=Amycolatopsis sp. TaxID=37632 RepID=UPI002D808EC9|nr:hypothetical protein [Amycolatopsis sp.]HET6709893.1 hypothetical protein [Amycolatopsis sp.]
MIALFCAVSVVAFRWPPALPAVPVAAFALLAASVVKLRSASRKIDTILAEELPGRAGE